jgi:hypothetical protein
MNSIKKAAFFTSLLVGGTVMLGACQPKKDMYQQGNVTASPATETKMMAPSPSPTSDEVKDLEKDLKEMKLDEETFQ